MDFFVEDYQTMYLFFSMFDVGSSDSASFVRPSVILYGKLSCCPALDVSPKLRLLWW